MSPITRPPPLPSIPRPCTAAQAAATTKANADNATTFAAKQANNARQSDGGGRGTSRTPAPTTSPASVAEPTILAVERANRAIGGRSVPEANAGRNHSGTSLPQAVDGTSAVMVPMGELLHEEKLAAEDTTTPMTSAPEPVAVNTTPRDVSREYTPAAATGENTSDIPGSLEVVGGSRQGQVAGTVASSSGSVVSTIAPSTRGGDNEGVVASSPSSSLVEHGQAGTTVAPVGSLVRLKRRRQQARTRSNSQR